MSAILKWLSAINTGAAYLVATLVGMVATFAFISSETGWGVLLVFIAPVLAIFVHELGHAFAAWALGMNVLAIAVGPVELRLKPRRFGLRQEMLGHDVGGYVTYDDSGRKYLTRRIQAAITAAGPLANLACTMVGIGLAQLFNGERIALLPGGFAIASLSAFVLSAWPFVSFSGRRNDAAQILQVLEFKVPGPRQKPKRSPWQAR